MLLKLFFEMFGSHNSFVVYHHCYCFVDRIAVVIFLIIVIIILILLALVSLLLLFSSLFYDFMSFA